ncbi:hypothetical protein [Marasmitruncus massiliensis]|uniref:hypothetical protein n=1 Tax=Marasmitruncus massiliensis TaxID=1944642 RepID=UPI000C799100|nr:hypothetical protein [Marasmitruncus massiliensis]
MPVKRTVRLSPKVAESVERIAREKHRTGNEIIESAIKFYSDYLYMQEHATVIPQEIVKVLQSTVAMAEQRINNKTNQVLSALAIETGTLEQIIAASLDVDRGKLKKYRENTVDFLKANNRVIRMDEVVE